MKVELTVLVVMGVAMVHIASALDEPKADGQQLQMQTPSTRLKDARAHPIKIQHKPVGRQRSYNDVLKDYDSSLVPKTFSRRRYTLPHAPTKRPPKKRGRVVPAIPHRGKHSAKSRLSLTGQLG